MNQELTLARRPAADGSIGGADEESRNYRQELIETFLKRAPDALTALETAYREFMAAAGKSESHSKLQELYRKLHSFSGVAGLAGLKRLGELCSSMEALLVEMHENPGVDTPSPRRTIGRAIEFLRLRFRDLAALPESSADRPARVLVVDDEMMSRRAAPFALDFKTFEVATHEDARASLELLSKRPFHLVVFDETMSGLTGSQMVARIRQGPPNESIPAILVLGRMEFEARMNERLPSNLDFIARAYPFAELAVKALMLLLAHQLVDDRPLQMKGGS
jgi:CheY-like chemotaxis protein/HPt (histidine-containing phosphotransfer) domain-containing protein